MNNDCSLSTYMKDRKFNISEYPDTNQVIAWAINFINCVEDLVLKEKLECILGHLLQVPDASKHLIKFRAMLLAKEQDEPILYQALIPLINLKLRK